MTWDGKERRDSTAQIEIVRQLTEIAGDIKVIRSEMQSIKEISTTQGVQIESLRKDRHDLINKIQAVVIGVNRHDEMLNNRACISHSIDIARVEPIEKRIDKLEGQQASVATKMVFASGFVGGLCALLPYVLKFILR